MKVFAFPGQGSQARGMGKELFAAFRDHVAAADAILGYSIEELCLKDPRRELSQTQFTQPALYVVNALSFLKRRESGETPDYLIGHSLGEYDALFAAGAFDFETGLRLVQRRGALMASAPTGGMAAVIGLDAERVAASLAKSGFGDIDIANLNGPKQTVISGPRASIEKAEAAFSDPGTTYIVLNVSASFHSRAMAFMVDEFRALLESVKLAAPKIPVIANATARPYRGDDVVANLAAQICAPVRWTESIRYLMAKGNCEFVEVGPGKVLATMVGHILKDCTPLAIDDEPPAAPAVKTNGHARSPLGSAEFREDYGLRRAYMAGSMGDGIASTAMVLRLAKAGLLGILGSAGISLTELEAGINQMQTHLSANESYGVNLWPHAELDAKVELLLRKGVRVVEASGFAEIATPLVRYRLRGLAVTKDGRAKLANRIIAKVSRPDIAELFMAPPPPELVGELLAAGRVTAAQAEAAKTIPMADDVVGEADSGSFSGDAPATVLVPALIRLRDAMGRRHAYARKIRIGAAGGIGTPEAAAAAFVMGADFVVTGSINQCTAEARTSAAAKDMLAALGVQDTGFAPADEGFESGAKVRVMTKSVFFPARANRLYELWRQHGAWEEVGVEMRRQVETRFLQRPFEQLAKEEEVRAGTRAADARERMARVFKWYLGTSARWAVAGEAERRVDFQVRTGPALGAFNQWVENSEIADWRARHVDDIAQRLMDEAARLLN